MSQNKLNHPWCNMYIRFRCSSFSHLSVDLHLWITSFLVFQIEKKTKKSRVFAEQLPHFYAEIQLKVGLKRNSQTQLCMCPSI